MRKLRISVLALLALMVPVAPNAWVYDTHYHLTFSSALSTCFDWDEAHLMASAAFMIDKNKETKAESNPLATRSKRNWHAFGHSTQRYTELWTRVLDEPDFELQLVKFGQFLHFLQDWESHAGFGVSLGHAVATVNGNDPDSMARSAQRTESQMQSTLDHMAQYCAHLDRLPEGARDSDEALIDFVGDFYHTNVLADLIVTSDPAWRKGRTGGLSKSGKRILAVNAARIDEQTEIEIGLVEMPRVWTTRLARQALQACSESRAEGVPENVRPVGEPDSSLRVLTLNAWHGLRSGESKTKFPGEDAARNQRRFNWQVAEIDRHKPDVLFMQEVNPNPKESRTYSAVLGYDEIHKVASCGIHLGFLVKIPKNVNEGLTILARPYLNLRRIGTKRLSGDALCTGTLGIQTKESRYVLFGEITVEGRPVLLAVTHLSSPRSVPPEFEEDLKRLVEQGVLLEEQRAEIVAKLESGRARNLEQVEKLLAEIDKQRKRLATDDWLPPVILAGDFNAQPLTAGVRLVEESGWTNVATGPEFLTWDPVTNHENHEIGTRRAPPVPTFEIPEVEELLAPRYETPRQIDYIFISGNARVLTAEMVLNEERDGLYPSDHFGILATLDWKEPPAAP